MALVKIIILIIFMFFSSKALGLYICDKLNIDREEKTAIGFLMNLALFFLSELPAMLLKLSSLYLNIFGILYLVIILLVLFKYIRNKKIFYFSKKEVIALILTLIFIILYMFFVYFGYIETYDSYFYSVLTNSAQKTEHISTIDPYTGQANIQNYYKYISYYYQSSFLANMLQISEGYLVLIWVMTFMNYLFVSITALTLLRISSNKYINNILTAFLLTFVLSIFRAPFNALHLVTMILSIYCFTYIFEIFKGKKEFLPLLLISIIAGISITSTMMFIAMFFILVFYIVACVLDKKEIIKYLIYISTPVIIILFLYIYESLDNTYILIIMAFIITLTYLFLLSKKLLNFVMKLGYPLLVLLPIIFIIIGTPIQKTIINDLLFKKDIIQSETEISSEEVGKIDEPETQLELIYETNADMHSSSMKYIYENKQNNISKVLILITHSSVLYGGMAFLAIYGILKLRNNPEFIAMIIYLIVIYNPLVKKGLSNLTLGLEGRIYLFFNTVFGIYGIKYLFELLNDKITNTKIKSILEKTIKYSSFAYITLVISSTILYVSQFKIIDLNKYDILRKVPNAIVEANTFLNEYIDSKKVDQVEYSRVFYTANVFNISMIDSNVNEKIKIINSKEYMGFFGNKSKTISDKLIISAFMDTEGKCYIIDKNNNKSKIKEKDIMEYIKNLKIEYIALKKPTTNEFQKYLNDNFEVLYSNNEIQIIQIK